MVEFVRFYNLRHSLLDVDKRVALTVDIKSGRDDASRLADLCVFQQSRTNYGMALEALAVSLMLRRDSEQLLADAVAGEIDFFLDVVFEEPASLSDKLAALSAGVARVLLAQAHLDAAGGACAVVGW